jgi:hypothetical protein
MGVPIGSFWTDSHGGKCPWRLRRIRTATRSTTQRNCMHARAMIGFLYDIESFGLNLLNVSRIRTCTSNNSEINVKSCGHIAPHCAYGHVYMYFKHTHKKDTRTRIQLICSYRNLPRAPKKKSQTAFCIHGQAEYIYRKRHTR